MSDYEFTISLSIRHPSIAPDSITRALGIEPQHAWKAGDPRRGDADEPLEGLYRESYWTGPLMPQPQPASGELSAESVLLRTLSQLNRSRAFLHRLAAEGGLAELHVSLYSRANFQLGLGADSLGLLGRLGLAIVLDVHPHSPSAAGPQGH